uniref:Putative homing endonuclease n=1 Tax=viral metagenome TaxID=1070528 RepID=A0A6M3M130_9ZZZZ
MKGNLLFFGHTHIDSSKKAISKSQMGENNSVWNGGRTVSAGGYISILFPSHPYANINGRVKEERLVMEKFLGRYLIKEEIVHHKNKDKQDNRLDNLQLVSVSEHLKIHWNDLDRKRLKMENRKSV